MHECGVHPEAATATQPPHLLFRPLGSRAALDVGSRCTDTVLMLGSTPDEASATQRRYTAGQLHCDVRSGWEYISMSWREQVMKKRSEPRAICSPELIHASRQNGKPVAKTASLQAPDIRIEMKWSPRPTGQE